MITANGVNRFVHSQSNNTYVFQLNKSMRMVYCCARNSKRFAFRSYFMATNYITSERLRLFFLEIFIREHTKIHQENVLFFFFCLFTLIEVQKTENGERGTLPHYVIISTFFI